MDPILSRESIESDADLAAQRCVLSGADQPCPHVAGTEAAEVWDRAYERGLREYSAAKVGAGA